MITYTFESTEYGKDGTANCSTSPRGACKCIRQRDRDGVLESTEHG